MVRIVNIVKYAVVAQNACATVVSMLPSQTIASLGTAVGSYGTGTGTGTASASASVPSSMVTSVSAVSDDDWQVISSVQQVLRLMNKNDVEELTDEEFGRHVAPILEKRDSTFERVKAQLYSSIRNQFMQNFYSNRDSGLYKSMFYSCMKQQGKDLVCQKVDNELSGMRSAYSQLLEKANFPKNYREYKQKKSLSSQYKVIINALYSGYASYAKAHGFTVEVNEALEEEQKRRLKTTSIVQKATLTATDRDAAVTGKNTGSKSENEGETSAKKKLTTESSSTKSTSSWAKLLTLFKKFGRRKV